MDDAGVAVFTFYTVYTKIHRSIKIFFKSLKVTFLRKLAGIN